jgi:hypothetical protein
MQPPDSETFRTPNVCLLGAVRAINKAIDVQPSDDPVTPYNFSRRDDTEPCAALVKVLAKERSERVALPSPVGTGVRFSTFARGNAIMSAAAVAAPKNDKYDCGAPPHPHPDSRVYVGELSFECESYPNASNAFVYIDTSTNGVEVRIFDVGLAFLERDLLAGCSVKDFEEQFLLPQEKESVDSMRKLVGSLPSTHTGPGIHGTEYHLTLTGDSALCACLRLALPGPRMSEDVFVEEPTTDVTSETGRDHWLKAAQASSPTPFSVIMTTGSGEAEVPGTTHRNGSSTNALKLLGVRVLANDKGNLLLPSAVESVLSLDVFDPSWSYQAPPRHAMATQSDTLTIDGLCAILGADVCPIVQPTVWPPGGHIVVVAASTPLVEGASRHPEVVSMEWKNGRSDDSRLTAKLDDLCRVLNNRSGPPTKDSSLKFTRIYVCYRDGDDTPIADGWRFDACDVTHELLLPLGDKAITYSNKRSREANLRGEMDALTKALA